MKKFFLIALALSFSLSLEAALLDSILIKRLNELSAQIQKKYAPDKRTEFFQLKLEATEPLTFNLQVTKFEAIQELRALLKSENISAIINDEVLPAKSLDGKIYGVANLSVINTRYAPNHAAEMATQATLGTPVKILKKEKGHFFVRTPDNYLSWTESEGVTPMNKTDYENWQAAEKVVYTDLFGFAYSEASESSLTISDLVAGNILQVLSESNGFYKIEFPDKRIAYISVKRAQSFDL